MDYAAGCRCVVVGLTLVACGFDSGGDGAASTGGTTSTGGTDPTTDPATTDPVTTSPTTTDPATTDPSTDPSTDPATTDPSTEPTTTDPSTDPTTTDPSTDPTTGDDTTDPSQGSSSGGDPGVYGPCDENTCPDDQTCAVAQNQNMTVIGNVCRPECDDIGDCPDAPSGSPELFCPSPNYPYCVLGCENGVCPDGMDCFPTAFGNHCHWPV